MPKRTTLTETLPLRVDPATGANVKAIIASGLAADRSAALRAGAAITARLLSDDPHVWAIVGPEGIKADWIFGEKFAAMAWLATRIGAASTESGEFVLRDEDDDVFVAYDIVKILPK